jgi:hypothetical protein
VPQKPAETRVGGQLCTIESAEIENERSEDEGIRSRSELCPCDRSWP